MKLVFCKSKNDGLWFINKRQSSDKVITQKIINDVKISGSNLWVSEYSKPMFENEGYCDAKIITKDSVFEKNDIVFIEDLDYKNFIDKADEILIIDWKRDYPATKKFNIPSGLKLKDEYSMVGHSHEEIILREYNKEEMNEKN